ncbi:amidohydrolase family protein [Dyella silvae]|uniref:amidohydrolase family protein n=1 Tax=Dyella silvae TaxID=2994424 RepID=UPI002264D4A0|nr:amidohydrolase family protein [Dyella silvae]
MRLLVLGLLVCVNLWPAAAQASAPTTTAFVHVNVVPMDRERVLNDQTVIVEGGKIVAMGPHLAVPANARTIDGHQTAYLSPGLADMHTHSETRNDLAVYVANGVTTVLQMGGAHSGFVDSLVPAANTGARPGPHVYTSFLVDGSTDYNGFVIKTPAEARAIVGLAKTNGYDFIKVYVGLSPEVFAALADEGHRLGMPLVGHGVTAVRLENQLAAGQVLVAHSEEFFYTFFTPAGAQESDVPPDTKRIPDAVALAKKYNATVTTDLATYAAIDHQMQRPDVVAAFLARPESAYLSPNDRLAWQRNDYVSKTAKLDAKLTFLRSLVKAMADAHVELVTGTDAPAIPGMLPGFSLHDDLDELVVSGLTRFQALSAATRNPGTFIARTKGGDPFGIIAPGYRADLILSAANPLETLSTLRTPVGVMAHGQWWDTGALKDLTDSVRDSYQRASWIP